MTDVNSASIWIGVWSFISPIISGIITAGTLTLLGWGYARYRDKDLESKIVESIGKAGVDKGIGTSGITIHNKTHVPVTLRKVEMLIETPKGEQSKIPAGSFVSFVLDYAGPAEFGLDANASTPEPNVRGFVELPPHTSGIWARHDAGIAHCRGLIKGGHFSGVRITVEYLTLLKKPKILVVTPPDHLNEMIAKSFDTDYLTT